MSDDIDWQMPYHPLLFDEEQGLRRQLGRELTPQHPLWGKDVRVIGRSQVDDDIVVQIIGSNSLYAIVHLVWGSGGDSEFPHTVFFASVRELHDAMWCAGVHNGFVEDFDPEDPRLWEDYRDHP